MDDPFATLVAQQALVLKQISAMTRATEEHMVVTLQRLLEFREQNARGVRKITVELAEQLADLDLAPVSPILEGPLLSSDPKPIK